MLELISYWVFVTLITFLLVFPVYWVLSMILAIYIRLSDRGRGIVL